MPRVDRVHHPHCHRRSHLSVGDLSDHPGERRLALRDMVRLHADRPARVRADRSPLPHCALLDRRDQRLGGLLEAPGECPRPLARRIVCPGFRAAALIAIEHLGAVPRVEGEHRLHVRLGTGREGRSEIPQEIHQLRRDDLQHRRPRRPDILEAVGGATGGVDDGTGRGPEGRDPVRIPLREGELAGEYVERLVARVRVQGRPAARCDAEGDQRVGARRLLSDHLDDRLLIEDADPLAPIGRNVRTADLRRHVRCHTQSS